MGGNLALSSGGGTTAGNVQLQINGDSYLTVTPGSVNVGASSNCSAVNLQANGTTQMTVSSGAVQMTAQSLVWQPSVVSANIMQAARTYATGSGATGNNLSILAQPGQSATTGGVGGNLIFSSGSGGHSDAGANGAPGTVQLQIGGMTNVTWAQGFSTWSSLVVNPTTMQTAPASDVPTQDLVFQPQAPFASATTNVTPGNFAINLPSPISGTNNGKVSFRFGGTEMGYVTSDLNNLRMMGNSNLALGTNGNVQLTGQEAMYQAVNHHFSNATGTEYVRLIPQASPAIYATSGDLQLGPATGSYLNVINSSTDTSATAGTANALPATPAGYLNIKIAGTVYKMPYYNV